MRIFKYEIQVDDEVYVKIPGLVKILSIQDQNGSAFIWALVEENDQVREHRFMVVGTGHKVPDIIDASDFIGTVQMTGKLSGLVFHFFHLGPCF